MGFNAELGGLVADIANRVDRWTAHAAWTIQPGSPASAEIASTEMKADGTPWGDRPVSTAYAYAQMATKLAIEYARCAALLIGTDRPAPGIETETRSTLEAGSVAWWLLDPGLTARQRVCRPSRRSWAQSSGPHCYSDGTAQFEPTRSATQSTT